jgi:hypothetical protein
MSGWTISKKFANSLFLFKEKKKPFVTILWKILRPLEINKKSDAKPSCDIYRSAFSNIVWSSMIFHQHANVERLKIRSKRWTSLWNRNSKSAESPIMLANNLESRPEMNHIFGTAIRITEIINRYEERFFGHANNSELLGHCLTWTWCIVSSACSHLRFMSWNGQPAMHPFQ